MTVRYLVKGLLQRAGESKFLCRVAAMHSEIRSRLAVLQTLTAESVPFQWFLEHKRVIALALYLLWLLGCGYWFYHFMRIDVQPERSMGVFLQDPRDALVVLFFGMIGLVFISFFALFIVKLIYNLCRDSMESLVPIKWHSVVKPISYMLILYCAFPYTATIKAAGLTVYNQVSEIVQVSRMRSVVIRKDVTADVEDMERKLNELLRFMEGDQK